MFTRAPIPGQTKTRLQKLLSAEACATLHTCFLMDLNAVCEETGKDIFVAYTPVGEEHRLIKIFGSNGCYFPQQGNDLGSRMAHSIATVIKMGYDTCVLMGSDTPKIKPEDIRAAFGILNDKDVVLGATTDGGYYLIGMNRLEAAVFEHQTYGYGNVLEETIAAINEADLTYGTICQYADIDVPADLFRFHITTDRQKLSGWTYTADYIDKLIEEYRGKWIEFED